MALALALAPPEEAYDCLPSVATGSVGGIVPRWRVEGGHLRAVKCGGMAQGLGVYAVNANRCSRVPARIADPRQGLSRAALALQKTRL